ncbi:hypothetical protein MBRA1_001409 [Malassezia brasiliensis]|uniref:ELYS-like domain-containing protein n=1 Tax=Malassezia brasiliensis TaxID=1821822 RepID=A0AAF0DRG8_9BASI|nr:hypothetical protein MBRA1_001409 [Malassezia brasiliensis]
MAALQPAPWSPEAYADVLLQTYLSPATDTDAAVWSEAYAADVTQRRTRGVDRKLLFDRLLIEAGIERTLFPPAAPSEAYVLLVAILTSTLDAPQQHALIYYLALEFDHAAARASQAGDAAEAHAPRAEALADALPVAPHLRTEMDGYWAVDHGAFASAVCQLRNATLLPIVAEMLGQDKRNAPLLLELYDVQGALPASAGAAPSDTALVQLRLLVEALAHVRGLGAAWNACRAWISAQPEASFMHDTLYGVLLQHCFAPPNRAAIQALLSLPLHADEEARIQAYALAPGHTSPRDAAVVVDTLLLKWVHEGRYVDALHLDRRAAQRERTHAFHHTAEAARLRQRRKALLDGVWSVLPAVQRETLAAPHGAEPMAEDDAAPAPAPRSPTALPRALPSSPGARRASVARTPSATHKKTSAASVREAPSPLRSNSPFAGWKRAAAPEAAPAARAREPGWGVPVPKVPARAVEAVVAEAEAADADMDDALDAVPAAPEAMDEADPEADALPSETAAATASAGRDDPDGGAPPTDAETEADDDAAPMPSPEVPRRRRGARRAAQRANEALRKALRPSEGADDPAIPGGFPLAVDEAPPAPSPVRRTRRSSRVSGDALSSSASLSALASPAGGRMPRSATHADVVAYPQASLARLEALHDARPIARRTRAQTAELESHGSQTSDVSEAPATPQPRTRTTRRLRTGGSTASGTPRSARRRSDK